VDARKTVKALPGLIQTLHRFQPQGASVGQPAENIEYWFHNVGAVRRFSGSWQKIATPCPFLEYLLVFYFLWDMRDCQCAPSVTSV